MKSDLEVAPQVPRKVAAIAQVGGGVLDPESSSASGDPAGREVSRIVLAMPPTTDIEQAKDILSAGAQQLSLAS